MNNQELLEASCRVALSGHMHDLGKFAERANLEVDKSKLDIHLQQYCPRHESGGRTWFSHRHAAYTALAWDIVENTFPELLGEDNTPFAAWNAPDVDDSIVNAAARHHKPETFLQWIIATADRVASGFEREEFEKYNRAEEGTSTGRNHYTARQLTLFEQVTLTDRNEASRADLVWRYPLKAQSVEAVFPIEATGYEHNDKRRAQKEYRAIWDEFRQALRSIPKSHRMNWPIWLDHFDSAWACYTQAIPAATAFNVRPEVSLYDHSRATAALAVALWRYHHDRGDDESIALRKLKDFTRPDWGEPKFLLVQGDFFGIQDFIFATGGETQRQAAKLLRGRSFYVSLLMECAALKVLETLALPPTSQIVNAAGRFLIVAPNTQETVTALQAIQAEMDRWFLGRTWGQSGIGLAWKPAACNDFLRTPGQDGESAFQTLMRGLFEQLEQAKARRFDLCGEQPPIPVFKGFLDQFHNERGVCAVDGRSPAEVEMEPGKWISMLAADQIAVGKHLAHNERVLLTNRSLRHNSLTLDIFGYHVSFTGDQDATGRFGPLAREGSLRRAWDYSLPAAPDAPLFAGYARRNINGYVPAFGEMNAWEQDRYQDIGDVVAFDEHPAAPKTLEHLARDDRWLDANRGWKGQVGLTVLKGDVDDLGRIFQAGLGRPTFAKMAALSRQMNAFFSLWLPTKCARDFPNTYTVFAGGDDFFLIGPWRSTMQLAGEMYTEFQRYVAGNPEMHFSAGMVMAKPGLPVRQLGEMAESALAAAKAHRGGGQSELKNAVTVFEQTVHWSEFNSLWTIREDLERLVSDIGLSTSYVYGLQYLADMAERLKTGDGRLEDALWNSRFAYRTRRMLEALRGMSEAERQRLQKQIGVLIGGGIHQYAAAFKIPLFVYLYHYRH